VTNPTTLYVYNSTMTSLLVQFTAAMTCSDPINITIDTAIVTATITITNTSCPCSAVRVVVTNSNATQITMNSVAAPIEITYNALNNPLQQGAINVANLQLTGGYVKVSNNNVTTVSSSMITFNQVTITNSSVEIRGNTLVGGSNGGHVYGIRFTSDTY